ncbi:MAG: hypothetical protein ACXAB9_14060 [Candidatus Thorarchaeota archaeon]
MKRNSLFKVFCCAITVLLLSSIITPLSGKAATVWSDYFNDGNYDGWTICENPTISNGSNWSAANNHLQLDQEDPGTITHPSNVAYGTWSFDFKVNETQIGIESGAGIDFISNDINNLTNVVDPEDWLCYWLRFRGYLTIEDEIAFSLDLCKWYGGVNIVINGSDIPISLAGWQHIHVTRNTTGWFSVYYNGSPTPIMEGEDTEMNTSELFVVSLDPWIMIDNIVVDDEVIPFTPLTTPPPPPDLLLIVIGVSAVVIILVLVIFIKRR